VGADQLIAVLELGVSFVVALTAFKSAEGLHKFIDESLFHALRGFVDSLISRVQSSINCGLSPMLMSEL